MNEYLPLILTVAGVAIVFAFLWRKGHFLRLTTYIQETREELRKWPDVPACARGRASVGFPFAEA